MPKIRAVSTERRALLVVMSLCLGVVAGIVVATLLLVAGAQPAHGIVIGGAAFVAVVNLTLKVFAAPAWL